MGQGLFLIKKLFILCLHGWLLWRLCFYLTLALCQEASENWYFFLTLQAHKYVTAFLT